MSPLIEPAGEGRSRVTFQWRARTPGETALVVINTITDRDRHRGDLSPHVMTGEGLLTRTYVFDDDLRASYQIYPCASLPGTDRASWREVLRDAVTDPLNPHTFRDASLLELPGAPAQPYAESRHGTPKGTMRARQVGGRRVWVYLPRGAGPYPVMVLLDGDAWAATIAPTLDNLIADGRIPPLVALLVDQGDLPSRARDLAMHRPFVAYLAGELLPWAVAELGVTADPARTIVAGQSLGGLTASYAALVAPGRFGNVLSQSGSYWYDDELLTRRYADEPGPAARFHVEVGRLEWMLLEENRRFAGALRAKGHQVSYTEYHGGHDHACWRGGLADGLIALASTW
jgi:enterochelin esterase-like enzyme